MNIDKKKDEKPLLRASQIVYDGVHQSRCTKYLEKDVPCAYELGIRQFVVTPFNLFLAKRIREKCPGMEICVAIDYPFGQSSMVMLGKMVEHAIEEGADEILFPLNQPAFEENDELVKRSFELIVEKANGHRVTVIVNMDHFSVAECQRFVSLVKETKIDEIQVLVNASCTRNYLELEWAHFSLNYEDAITAGLAVSFGGIGTNNLDVQQMAVLHNGFGVKRFFSACAIEELRYYQKLMVESAVQTLDRIEELNGQTSKDVAETREFNESLCANRGNALGEENICLIEEPKVMTDDDVAEWREDSNETFWATSDSVLGVEHPDDARR